MILVIIRFQILVDFLKMVTNIKQVVFFFFFKLFQHAASYLKHNSSLWWSVEMYLKLQFVSV